MLWLLISILILISLQVFYFSNKEYKRVKFDPLITIYSTYSSDDYDR